MKNSLNKTPNLLKLLTIVCILFLGNLTAKGQYVSPYTYASILSYSLEKDLLKNITFNEKELKLDEDAWLQYKYYQERNAETLKKIKKYSITGYVGLGLVGVSLIPLFIGMNADYDDPKGDIAIGCSIGLLTSGGIITTIGSFGVLALNDRLNNNKKELIIYLKSNHNGLGIVSVF